MGLTLKHKTIIMKTTTALLLLLTSTLTTATSVRGAVPSSGICANEGDFKTGNHCVKMKGEELKKFQQITKQDFNNPSEWCICLHLFDEQGGSSKFPGADSSQCSEGALSAKE